MSGLALGNVGETIALAVIALLVMLPFLSVVGGRRRSFSSHSRRFWSPYRSSRGGASEGPDLHDAGQQLHAVMAASFRKRRLLNFSEYRVFKIIESDVAASRGGYRVFAQTSLGEILQSPDSNAFRSINSKRIDVLIIDRGGWPILAVEYQGEGHYQGTAAARDAVKKEALRKAGVGYIEVSATDTEAQIRTRVREYLGWETDTPANWTNASDTNVTPASGFGRRQCLTDSALSPRAR